MVKELDIEKIIRRVQTDADKKSEHRFDGMMEEIRDNFKKVSEQFKNVYEKFEGIDQRFDTIEKKLISNTNMIATLAMDTHEVKSCVKEIKSGLQNKVSTKDLVALDRRVRVLEKK